MAILIDTSALVAYTYSKDVNHRRAAAFFEQVTPELCYVPAPVLVELFFMCLARVGYDHAIRVFT